MRSNIRDLAHDRARFGYLQIWELLQREGRRVNLKEARRSYSLDGLQLWMLVRCPTHTALHRKPAPGPVGLQERWSMDFVHNALADTRPYRILTVVDQWSCFSPVRDRGGPTLPPVQSVIPRRSIQPQEPTGPSHSNRKVPEHPARGAFARGIQAFFASTSCRMTLSKVRSATSRLSLRFSSSSCRNRRISAIAIWP